MKDNSMLIEKLYLKAVDEKDCDLIFVWANEKENRDNSFNKDKISYIDHKTWFSKKLTESEDFYILKSYEKNIGQIRLDKASEGYIISYSIDLQYRGKGYGKEIIKLLESKMLMSNEPKILVAYVKPKNIKSIKIFQELNYRESIENNFYKYIKKIGDSSD